jgi:anaerobic ribonucleoside-triphosphate reductase
VQREDHTNKGGAVIEVAPNVGHKVSAKAGANGEVTATSPSEKTCGTFRRKTAKQNTRQCLYTSKTFYRTTGDVIWRGVKVDGAASYTSTDSRHLYSQCTSSTA